MTSCCKEKNPQKDTFILEGASLHEQKKEKMKERLKTTYMYFVYFPIGNTNKISTYSVC